jgi:endoglucanase
MRRAVNLGNALEAPDEGDWGYRIEAEHLSAIADAGFDGVRLPVRWDGHALDAPPFTIGAAFFGRVEQVVQQALECGLSVQMDLHHYDDFTDAGPRSPHRARYLAIWRQISEHFASAPPTLLLEPFNEFHGLAWSPGEIVQLQSDVVGVIRERNPTRTIVLGPGQWQSLDGLRAWQSPLGENLAASFHYYEPGAFTGSDGAWLPHPHHYDRLWGADADRGAVTDHIARAAAWAGQHQTPLQVGEFGVNRMVPVAQRAFWTRTVREACEAHGIGWCVWDFAGEFPIWDKARGRFIPEMLAALMH